MKIPGTGLSRFQTAPKVLQQSFLAAVVREAEVVGPRMIVQHREQKHRDHGEAGSEQQAGRTPTGKSKMLQWLWKLALLVLMTVGLLSAYLYVMQSRMIFYPNMPGAR